MKKYIAFIIFGAVFLLIAILAIFNAIKRKEISFEGVVTDKNIVEEQMNNNNMGMMNMGRPSENIIGIPGGNMMGGGVKHIYKVTVQPDQGKQIHYTISEGMYEIVKIGDRVSKPKGATEITILQTSQTPPPPPVSNQPPSSDQTPPPPIPPATPLPPQDSSPPQSFA